MPRRIVTWKRIPVALPPRGRALTAAQQASLADRYSAADRKKALTKQCKIIFYTRDRFGMRCKADVGGLAKAAKKRFRRMERRGDVCRVEKTVRFKKGPRKGQRQKLLVFVRCPEE